MLESLRQFYDKAADFCREQSEALMIGGAVLIVLVILIAVIRSVSKKGKDDDYDFDEELYMEQLRRAAEKNRKQPASFEDNRQSEEERRAEEKRAEEKITEEKPAEEYLLDKERKSEHGPLQSCKKSVIFPDELIEEIAKASSNDLQEVEIKIQSAELRIRYTGYKGGDGLKEEVRHFAENEKSQESNVPAADNGNKDSADIKEETEKDKESQQDIEKEILKEKINPEEIPEEDIKRPGKFGPDNFNTARSGRVYTEEELEKQIRD